MELEALVFVGAPLSGGIAEGEEGPGGVGGALESLAGAFGEESSEPGAETGGEVEGGVEGRQRLIEVRLHDSVGVVAAIRRVTVDEPVGQTPQGVEVGPGAVIAPPAGDLFGGHKPGGAGDFVGQPVVSGLVVGSDVEGVGEPEIGQFQVTAVGALDEEDVARFEVPVNDPAGVGVGQGVEDPDEDVANLPPVEVVAVEVLEAVGRQLHGEPRGPGDKAAPAVVFDLTGDLPAVEDHDDAGVMEAGDGADFAPECGAHVGVAGPVGVHDFEGHRESTVDVDGPKDLAHSAGSDGG